MGSTHTTPSGEREALHRRYEERKELVYRALRPPLPVVQNTSERTLPLTEGVALWIGAAGQKIPGGFVGIDIINFPGVDLVADVEAMPFLDKSVSRIECDAVLEHVRHPNKAVGELFRLLKPGGYLHIVVPFCHPVHMYPGDYSRWTMDGLRELVVDFDVIDIGVRTGPTATLLTVLLEYLKLLAPKPVRKPIYAVVGWVLWPLRYLDKAFYGRADAHILANTIYVLVRRPMDDLGQLSRTGHIASYSQNGKLHVGETPA